MSDIFKITLFVSLSWHLLFLGAFEPVINVNMKPRGADSAVFLGSLLQARDIFRVPFLDVKPKARPLSLKTEYPLISESDFLSPSIKYALKPRAFLSGIDQKTTFLHNRPSSFVYKPKEKPALTFYPLLPYSFLFYFTDRQSAHMEFTFHVSDNGKITFVKRKVSSGDLETDLLAYRYITHCLFLQEGRFPMNSEQSVKIDLTRKEND